MFEDEQIKYICTKCGNFCYADNINVIVQRDKKCVDCINEKRKLFKKECSKKYKKDLKIYSFVQCVICNKSFNSYKAKYCSSVCRSKGIQNNKFYKDLKTVNKVIEIQKFQVYGFGSSRYEDNKIKKEIGEETKKQSAR